jgi:hypothetical protein
MIEQCPTRLNFISDSSSVDCSRATVCKLKWKLELKLMFDGKFSDKAGIFVMLLIPPSGCGRGTDNAFIDGQATKASVYKSRSEAVPARMQSSPIGSLQPEHLSFPIVEAGNFHTPLPFVIPHSLP